MNGIDVLTKETLEGSQSSSTICGYNERSVT